MDLPSERNPRPVPPPSFRLLREGDTPVLEKAEDLLGVERGGYLPEPEPLSIFDPTPHPEKPDYLRVLAAILAVLFLAVGVRVGWYYATNRGPNDRTPLERRAKYAAAPAPSAAPAVAEPADDTVYWAQAGTTLPLLRSKPQAPRGKSPGTVILSAVVDAQGRPVNLQVMQGIDPDTNVLAMQNAGQWRFRPGARDGKPVPVAAQLEVIFR